MQEEQQKIEQDIAAKVQSLLQRSSDDIEENKQNDVLGVETLKIMTAYLIYTIQLLEALTRECPQKTAESVLFKIEEIYTHLRARAQNEN